MNTATHNKYFRDIAYNQDPSVTWPTAYTWPYPTESAGDSKNTKQEKSSSKLSSSRDLTTPVYAEATSKIYEARLQELIATCRHTDSLTDIKADGGKHHTTLVLHYTTCSAELINYIHPYYPVM